MEPSPAIAGLTSMVPESPPRRRKSLAEALFILPVFDIVSLACLIILLSEVRSALSKHESNVSGTLFLVSTPIGNLGDFTYRAVEILRSCGTILAEDTRRTRILLDHYDIRSEGLTSFHQHNEATRTQEIRERLAAGDSVALVSDAGTPLVSDPGLRLVRAALDVGASVVPIPGPSSVLAALVGSGLDPEPFTFFGFLPRSGKARAERIEQLASLPHTAVLFESPHRTVAMLEELAAALGPERQAVVAREVTKIHEEFVRGTLSEVAAYYGEHEPRGEVVVCVAGASGVPQEDVHEAARSRARDMIREGASSKDIVRALRNELGLDRNRAYAIALEAAAGEQAE